MAVRKSLAISCRKLGLDFGAYFKMSGSVTFCTWIRIRSLSTSMAITRSRNGARLVTMTGYGQRAVSVQWTYTAPVASSVRNGRLSQVYPRVQPKLVVINSQARSGEVASSQSDAASTIGFVSLPVPSSFDLMKIAARFYVTAKLYPTRYQGTHRSSER